MRIPSLCTYTLAFLSIYSIAKADNLSQMVEQDIATIVANLSLEAKVGQMIQAELLSVLELMNAGQHPIKTLGLGSILSGGDSIIEDNSVSGWKTVLNRLQEETKTSESRIPLMLGVDAVHGHGILRGATVFPHSISFGAAKNPQLLEQVGKAIAEEVLATGFNWTFVPGVIVAKDIRWGRTYESFGESPELQTLLAGAYVRGLQGQSVDGVYLAATAKHFLGDGGTKWGTGKPGIDGSLQLDQGDTQGELPSLIATHIEGYKQAIAEDVFTIMTSYSSINGTKMHGHKDLVENFLKLPKNETINGLSGLGFNGFIISDWNAIDQLEVGNIADPLTRYKKQIIKSVDAGVDMIMVEGKLENDSKFRFERVQQLLLEAVREGSLSETRINNAVQRIIRIKMKMGLMNNQTTLSSPYISAMNFQAKQAEHRNLARQAARESFVLLKNNESILPIDARKYKTICIAGKKANDYGAQVGAWTIGWQGSLGNAHRAPGDVTILEGIVEAAKENNMRVVYEPSGTFTDTNCISGNKSLTIAVVGEKPYAEYSGDRKELRLDANELTLLNNARKSSAPMAVIIISGRPIIVTEYLPQWQALIAAWQPGSQADSVADVLFGKFNFVGTLPVTWPASMEQLPTPAQGESLFPYGFALKY